ncbi:MAG: putative Ig domain-containing protein, partial [Terriglobales bacterium]
MRKFRVFLLVALGILVWVVVFAGCSGSNSLTVTLAPASGQSLNPGQTVTITATVANDNTNGGVTWTLSGPGTLSGNTKTTVVYTAPTSLSVTSTATITATSVANSTITATESITVNAVLTITTSSLPAGTLNVPYNSFVNAAGAPVPFTWSVISGSLPAGLTFLTTSTSSSAEITGTPTLLGTSKFSVQVTDSSGTSVTQALSITINTPPPLSVVTGSLPAGIVNTPYSQNLQANSGTLPYTWSLANGTLLPIGLSLSSSGVISGTPIVNGTFNFTVQVKDSSTPNPQTASANLSITINPG